jgi:hypothetical protein
VNKHPEASFVTGLPAETNLLPRVFLEIPTPADAKPFEAIKKDTCIVGPPNFLMTLANAGKRNKRQAQAANPSLCEGRGLIAYGHAFELAT